MTTFNNQTVFNTSNILKVLNAETKDIIKTYETMFAATDEKPSVDAMKLAIIQQITENQIRKDCSEAKSGKFSVNRINFVEKLLDKFDKSEREVFKKVFFTDNSLAYFTNMHWCFRTEKVNLEGINPSYIITDKDKDKYTIIDYTRVFPKAEKFTGRMQLNAKDIKAHCKLYVHGKKFDKPYTVEFNNQEYYISPIYLQVAFKYYGTETLTLHLQEANKAPLGITVEDKPWNLDDNELMVLCPLNPKYVKSK